MTYPTGRPYTDVEVRNRPVDLDTSDPVAQLAVTVYDDDGTTTNPRLWVHNTAGQWVQLSGITTTAAPSPASEGGSGVLEIATQPETDAATDDGRAVTPRKLGAYQGLVAPGLIPPLVTSGLVVSQSGADPSLVAAWTAGEAYNTKRYQVATGTMTLPAYSGSATSLRVKTSPSAPRAPRSRPSTSTSTAPALPVHTLNESRASKVCE